MDEAQLKIVKMANDNPMVISDRRLLKAALSDYIPQDKRQQNLVLNAFDEDIINKFTQSADVTFQAIKMIDILVECYGLTRESASWAVITWCYIMKYDEIAEVVQRVFSANQIVTPPTTPICPTSAPAGSKIALGQGMYLAGIDFVAGDIKLEPARSNNRKEIYYAIIKKGTNKTEINGFFKTQMYLAISDGQRLEVHDNVLLSNV